MKLSNYIANRLFECGIEDVFMVTGGGAMHLNDSFGKHPHLRTFFNHHEQACAIAAESYARLTGRLPLVSVTSGPGGTNALTGVLGAFLDSIPMLIISGQVRYDTTVHSTKLPLRQLGDQEFDIVRCVSGMTKYARMITDPGEIGYHLDRALHLAASGRPGPCWLDIPMNIQGADIDPSCLKVYDPSEDAGEIPPPVDDRIIKTILSKISMARRPVLMAGSGIRTGKAHGPFLKLIELLNIPVVTAWNAHDNLHDDHPLYFGRPGSVGDRAGNFIVQNSDFLMVLGCRLNIRQISYNWENFAREAFKVIVDIDPSELQKPTIRPDIPVNADVLSFAERMVEYMDGEILPPKEEWLDWCFLRKKRYPVVLKEYWERDSLVNPYCFVDVLSRHLDEDEVTVTGDGSACVCTFQAAVIRKGQRLYTNSGCASMGYDLPAGIGACIGLKKKRVICLAGDGSLQMNIQELQTIRHYDLPLKIFVLNNNGYHSIRQTQQNFFGEPLVGCDPESGVTFPDLERIAYAYGIPFFRCFSHAELEASIVRTLNEKGPVICEVMLAIDQPFSPKLSSFRRPDGRIVSKPLEDLFPFLSRGEFMENMIINPLSEDD